jgi:hypothetical protein
MAGTQRHTAACTVLAIVLPFSEACLRYSLTIHGALSPTEGRRRCIFAYSFRMFSWASLPGRGRTERTSLKATRWRARAAVQPRFREGRSQ